MSVSCGGASNRLLWACLWHRNFDNLKTLLLNLIREWKHFALFNLTFKSVQERTIGGKKEKTLKGCVNILKTEWLASVHGGFDKEGRPVTRGLPALQWGWSCCPCSGELMEPLFLSPWADGAVVLVPRELMEPLSLSLWAGNFVAVAVTHSAFSPAPYVKVYLLDNGVCIAKKKTKVARKTLEPLYQQLLSFEESPQGKVLQVCTPCWPLTLESTLL